MLYAGPLSQEAQRILAVLRAQNLNEPGCIQLTRSRREMERFTYSQGESGAPSSWNQVEGTERDADRPRVFSFSTSDHYASNERQSSQTPDGSLSSRASSCLTSQTVAYDQRPQTYSHSSCPEPSLAQREVPETQASFWHGDGCHLSLLMPDRPSEPQQTTCRNSAGGMRSSLALNKFPDKEGPDEMWASTTEQPNSHKQEPAATCHPISSCPAIREETDYTSDTRCEEKSFWNISTSEPGDAVASGSRLKRQQHLSRPAGGTPHQQLESETAKTKRGYAAPSGLRTEVETEHKMETRRREAKVQQVLVVPPFGCEEESKPAEASYGERRLTAELSQGCERRPPCLLGNQQRHANVQGANGSSRETKSGRIAAGLNCDTQDSTSAAAGPCNNLENQHLPPAQSRSRHPLLAPKFPLKRRHDVFQSRHADPPPKIYQTRRPPWEPPRFPQERAAEGEAVFGLSRGVFHPALAQESPPKISRCEAGAVFEVHAESQTKRAKCRTDPVTDGPEGFNEVVKSNEPQGQLQTGWLPAALICDARVKDCGKLNPEERTRMLQEARGAKVLVLTMVYRDGTTQLDPEQKLTPPVCGLLVLMKSDVHCSTPEDSLGPSDSLIYLKLEHTPPWAQQQTHHAQELFTRDILLQILSTSQLVVCYKAKDFLRSALQLYRRDLSWKQVAGAQIQDPQVSGWLLDPSDPSSCYSDLLHKHCKRPSAAPAPGAQKISQIISGLYRLYKLNMNLCSKLQSQGLWELFSDMELNMIPVLAAMESHRIHVDKEALKRTSDLLGAKMKQLEQEAHRAAGQMFLVTSNTQLRTVLFEKLRLHERCEHKKLPKTTNKQQRSTSEAALLQLQDLHPLPKIILEYRQVHKIKSTFVDGILSCMRSKNYISSTWYQTSVVSGRISSKHPNFQALPRQPLQIRRKRSTQGKEEEEVVTVHPRASFIPQEGWTFLSADFCQVELRLLAHLSSDPELLRIFTDPQADVFAMLASQWKGMSVGEVTPEDREHAKRIVYSVVYGAGRERLSGILGVSAEQASRFQSSFLQTYRDVQAFVQRTIQQSHKQGYVLSIMGRRRNIPNIDSPDWSVRMQAERQAVNFVVQGSAADLCKMAMIRIFSLVSSSSSLSARLLAQLHDELLYEVEDSQVEQFAALVRSTMESLQHIDHLGVHLKVPLKVAVSSGKSWGSMSELNTPLLSPPS